MAAGVKPAALITRITSSPKPSPAFTVKPAGPPLAKPNPVRQAKSKKVTKTRHSKATVRQTKAPVKAKARAQAGPAPVRKIESSQKPVAAARPAKPSPGIAKGEEQQ